MFAVAKSKSVLVLRAAPHPLPNPSGIFRQQPQRRHAETPQRIVPTPINQRCVIVHALPIIELRDLQQRSNAIRDIDRLSNQSVQVTRLDEPSVRRLIGPPKLLEL